MKTLIAALSTMVIVMTAPAEVQARAGTLVSCEGINTAQGYRYVGTYCVDYQCKYTVTRVFTSYCPYNI
jgi:hypothetical protein